MRFHANPRYLRLRWLALLALLPLLLTIVLPTPVWFMRMSIAVAVLGILVKIGADLYWMRGLRR